MRISLGGSVAQSVEQRTFNPLVASSNLARPTKKSEKGFKTSTFKSFNLKSSTQKIKPANCGFFVGRLKS